MPPGDDTIGAWRVWRSPELEVVIGGPLDTTGLTEVALQGLVSGRVREGELLDFKRRSYSAARDSAAAWSPEQEFAKDVTAFANHRGGLLLIGVEDAVAVAVSCEASVADPGGEEQRLRRALLNSASPLPRVEFVAIPSDGGGNYLAVVIPPSPAAPHAVLGRPVTVAGRCTTSSGTAPMSVHSPRVRLPTDTGAAPLPRWTA